MEINHHNLKTVMKDNFVVVKDNLTALTSLTTQQFAAMTTSTSQNKSNTCITSLTLNPPSYESMVINTSFPIMHIPLPISLPQTRSIPTTTQIYTPPPLPLSFSQPPPSLHSTHLAFTTIPTTSVPPHYNLQHNLFPSFPQNSNIPQPSFRTPKIELGIFYGTNALEWLFQARQFFSFYNIPHENRLPMTSFYMKGETLGWYKCMFQNHELSDWHAFSKAFELRFRPSTYENHQANYLN